MAGTPDTVAEPRNTGVTAGNSAVGTSRAQASPQREPCCWALMGQGLLAPRTRSKGKPGAAAPRESPQRLPHPVAYRSGAGRLLLTLRDHPRATEIPGESTQTQVDRSHWFQTFPGDSHVWPEWRSTGVPAAWRGLPTARPVGHRGEDTFTMRETSMGAGKSAQLTCSSVQLTCRFQVVERPRRF